MKQIIACVMILGAVGPTCVSARALDVYMIQEMRICRVIVEARPLRASDSDSDHLARLRLDVVDAVRSMPPAACLPGTRRLAHVVLPLAWRDNGLPHWHRVRILATFKVQPETWAALLEVAAQPRPLADALPWADDRY